jgi:CRISPR system Cascade subunit CasC
MCKNAGLLPSGEETNPLKIHKKHQQTTKEYKMFIELHILQSFAPSNLNRDDTGNPKDTDFGGVRRARISSQCVKRAIRHHPSFAAATGVDTGVRTRWMTRLIAPALVRAGKPVEEADAVALAFSTSYAGLDKNHNNVLIFLSQNEIAESVRGLVDHWEEITASLKDTKSPALEKMAKELFKNLKNRTSAPDIALFGRMLAEHPDLNIDAASQVAHAISTHRVSMELDYYTAVDDLITEDESGAGMVGVIPFNSACFYRYARLDWDQLLKNLGGDHALARNAVTGFLRAAVLAVPTGKQNSFAAQNPPDLVLGVVRSDGQSWSLANAFEKPVQPGRDGGLVNPSIAALDAYWARLRKVYGDEGILAAVLATDEQAPLDALRPAAASTFSAWQERILAGLPQE